MVEASVVILENGDVYSTKEFEKEELAIKYLKEQYEIYKKGEYDNINKDILFGILKITFNDGSDKQKSLMLCGLNKEKNEKIWKEI
jgi:hypothetical protein